MNDHARRKELREQYAQTRPEAGVYRIVNARNGRVLLGSTLNLPSMRSKLEFARATGTFGVLGFRLSEDIAAFGIEAFSLEIIEVLDVKPDMTSAQIRDDLATLEALWRERQDPALLY